MRDKVQRRRRNVLIAVAAAVLVLLLSLPLLVIGPRRDYQLPEPDFQESVEMQRALGKIFMLARNQRRNATLVFSQGEVNALLRQALRVYNVSRKPEEPSLQAQWHHGTLVLDASLRQRIGALNLHAAAVPHYSDGKFAVKLRSVRCGLLPVPAALCAEALNEQLQEFAESSDGRKTFAVFRECRVLPDGSLKLVLSAAEAGRLVRKIL